MTTEAERLTYANATPEKRAAIMACRVWEKTNTRDDVVDILKAMEDWYNGYEFLWSHGGWKNGYSIPPQYRESFNAEMDRRELMEAMGLSPSQSEYVTAVCLMQAVRWFAGFNPDRGDNRDGAYYLYHATAAVMAMCLSHDVDAFEHNERWEGVVIRYNDTLGRTFAGIVDLIKSARAICERDSSWNKTLEWAVNKKKVDEAGEEEYPTAEDSTAKPEVSDENNE